MKVLKLIGIILVVVISIVVVGMSVQTKVHVQRTEVIHASKDEILQQLIDFREFNQWSPWTEYDVNCKYEYSEKQGEIGSLYSWAGNEEVGVGSMELIKITENRVDIKLIFTSPWESESLAYYELSEAENGVNVLWGYNGEMPMLMSFFMDMDKMLGSDYEVGLKNLKSRVE